MRKYLEIATEAAVEAGKEILKVYEKDFRVYLKEDQSPLTDADTNANKIITAHLSKTGIPIISEESEEPDYSTRKDWDLCWMVDPLDGTKEFIKRNGEFTVNIALCKKGIPVLGVIYVPVGKEMYYAEVLDKAAYKTLLLGSQISASKLFRDEDRIYSEKPQNGHLKVAGSKSFMNKETIDYIETIEKTYGRVEVLPKGSSLKFCMLAEGKAHIYPRFAPSMEWDTAAGQAICSAVGLKVFSSESESELRYNKENLLNPSFVVQHP